MNIILACEFSGTVRDAFIAAGHNAWSCDLLPGSGRNRRQHIQDDIRRVLSGYGYGLPNGRLTYPDYWHMALCFPPCTRLANSGVRWLHKPPAGRTLPDMWREFQRGVELYQFFQTLPIHHKAIENPVMHKYAREALQPGKRHIVQPWWFGDPAFKATGFELFNLPPLQPTHKLVPPKAGTEAHKAWSLIHRCPPGPDRQKIRSTFFPGMAAAMASQWGNPQP
jgi:hypothetical protein